MTEAVSRGRRRFVTGLAAGGIVATAGGWQPAHAATGTAQAAGAPVLTGTEFALDVAETAVNYTGAARMATTVNGLLPGPVLRWREGDTVTLHVRNRLSVATSIHWHGILLPSAMDGVPGLSFAGIAPGSTFTYRFPVRQSGTYWYHSHSGFQEQTGLYGALVIDPAEPDPIHADRDYTVLLSDWTDEDPMRIFHKLKSMPDYYNRNQPTLQSLARRARGEGWGPALADQMMWQRMRMRSTDLADVSGSTYTYLVNGTTPSGNWTALFQPGERVRLRIINGSAMTYFDVRIPGLKLTVVGADGQAVQPVTVDEFRIGVAETYDVIVEPREERAYTVFAQSMDRSGYARATLAPRHGMQANIPPVDPVQPLTMMDMGMRHDMAGMQPAASGGDMGGMDMSGDEMDMSDDDTQASDGGMQMSHDGMQMSHGAMHMPRQHADMPADAHAGHGAATGGMVEARHPYATEHGVSNAMLPDMVSTRLDDPGPGLRDNGRVVLTYANLRSIAAPGGDVPPTREIELHLTGNMDRYMWSFNGVAFTDARPIVLKHGERVRFVLVNDTMMTHPIHLHGLWSDLESPDGAFQVRKHTISLNPAQRITYRVSADTRGNWAYHCHLLYHMEAGMFRAVVVA
ncbi:copper oxidase [Bordetella genomosp. 8]|uniref:Copper oxidase n=1 Tax=Bordetella genomosp. 8 TaxID=1416806 RepID=A0A1W6YTJ5_9BORD|nr:copper resistance system multicopper oxidase [Bordetella genomosp. 8]ARP84304.1 copper oxidase [Bordetella genomosp. 8]